MTAPSAVTQDRSAAALRRGSLLMAVGVGAVLGSLVYSTYRVRATEETVRANKARIAQQESTIATNEKRIEQLVPSALQGFGWAAESTHVALSTEQPRVQQSLQANEVLHQYRPANAVERSTIRVLYFAKDTTVDLNQRVIIQNLRDLGYRVAVRPPPVPDVPTNAIWFGGQVDTAEVKAIAYTLIRAGSEIKAIRPFRQSGGAKAKDVQIGADRAMVGRKPLTVEDVRSMKEFERDVTTTAGS